MQSAALVVVNYRSARLAIEAIRSARAASSVPLQVIVVDNSMDETEAALLRPHAERVIVAEGNLGYAAAINRARKFVDAGMMIVSNPDVRYAPGCITKLLDVDAAVAGPALYWDDAFEWMLPPSELHTSAEVLDRALASRSRFWAGVRDRRRIRSRLRFWSLRAVTPVRALSGAVLAIRTAAFDRAGGFDERFRLYFEENDFLRRVSGGIVYVPEARCRHIYNQSAAASPEAAAMFEESRRAYAAKWSGAMARVLARLERPLRAVALTAHRNDDPIAVPPNAIVEASPLASFDTAAGHVTRSPAVVIPDDVWAAYRFKSLFIRVIDRASGTVLATYSRSKIAS